MKLSFLVKEMLEPNSKHASPIDELFNLPAGAGSSSFVICSGKDEAFVDVQAGGMLAARLEPGTLEIDLNLSSEQKLVNGSLKDSDGVKVGFVSGYGQLFVFSSEAFCVVSLQREGEYAA